MSRARRALIGATVLVATLALTGCSGSHPSTSPSVSLSAPTTTAPPPPAPAPPVGGCYRLSFSQATKATTGAASVSCRSRHTAVTVYVGHSDPLVDGHLMAADSQAVQKQLAQRCPGRLATYVGGDEQTRRLSRLATVWFGPQMSQAQLGARWFRCDVVALADDGTLAPLHGSMRHALDAPDALDRWGTCGTTAPSAARFRRVICSEPHAWQAVSVVELPAGSRFLGKAATAAANLSCHTTASNRAHGALKYTWSFEWPTRAQWRAGQHYGFCWVPAT